ncbi:hypothetical protein [Methylorubrum thiocyanatum]|uniref:hypothetical protein n=1 Tax=Methylorubrum thiocyanatum TaxID=47958 RepID=UPI00398C5551
MVNQALFDEVADRLVEQGIRVTYDSVNAALKERDRLGGGPGRGKSDRDLQIPFADWKRRRRYRPHLAHLDLSDGMEKAIAAFVARAIAEAGHHAGAPPEPPDPTPAPDPNPVVASQLADLAASMQAQLATLAEECRLLREQAREPSAGHPSTQKPSAPLKREERRRGLAAATGRFFWDRMMQVFVEAIRERGPMSAAQLLETLDEDALAIAAAAFEEVTVSLIKEKVEFRISKRNYFRMTDEGLYDVLPKHAARGRDGGNR